MDKVKLLLRLQGTIVCGWANEWNEEGAANQSVYSRTIIDLNGISISIIN